MTEDDIALKFCVIRERLKHLLLTDPLIVDEDPRIVTGVLMYLCATLAGANRLPLDGVLVAFAQTYGFATKTFPDISPTREPRN